MPARVSLDGAISVPLLTIIVSFLSVSDHLCCAARTSKTLNKAARSRLSWARHLDLSRVSSLGPETLLVDVAAYMTGYGLDPKSHQVTQLTWAAFRDQYGLINMTGWNMATLLGSVILQVTFESRVSSGLPVGVLSAFPKVFWSCTSLELRGVPLSSDHTFVAVTMALIDCLVRSSSVGFFKYSLSKQGATQGNHAMAKILCEELLGAFGNRNLDDHLHSLSLPGAGLIRAYWCPDDYKPILLRLVEATDVYLQSEASLSLYGCRRTCPRLERLSGHSTRCSEEFCSALLTACATGSLPLRDLELSASCHTRLMLAVARRLSMHAHLDRLSLDDYQGGVDELNQALSSMRRYPRTIKVSWRKRTFSTAEVKRLDAGLVTLYAFDQCFVADTTSAAGCALTAELARKLFRGAAWVDHSKTHDALTVNVHYAHVS